MSEKKSKLLRGAQLVGADGKEIKTFSVPTVKFKDFIFPINLLKKEDVVSNSVAVRPGDLIKEYRARCGELQDRVQILTAILCTLIEQGPEVAKEFLDSVGLKVVDLYGKVVYEPSKRQNTSEN